MKQIEDDMQLRKLAEGIQNSDSAAFDELFRATYPRLVRFAFSITQDWNASCDITQDAFVMLWQHRNTVDPNRSVRALLFRTVRNRSFNYLRDRRDIADPQTVEAMADHDPPDGIHADDYPVTFGRTDNQADRKTDNKVGNQNEHVFAGSDSYRDWDHTSGDGYNPRLLNKLKEWVSELPERQREAFELSRYEGLYHHEIAEIMKVSVKTVNNHLTNALKQLRSRHDTWRNASPKRP